jgi:teichuronic acid biosynthesis glycosyltransferase TuaC
MKALVFTTLYPNAANPLNAVFVRRRMEAWAQMPGNQMTVIAPVPWFPRLPFKTLPHWDQQARVPALERPWGYDIHHPRYLVTPKVGMRWYGRWMTAATLALAQQLHARERFDLIDAHYVFPDGEAAVAVGAALGLPVVLSSRGTDLNLYPQLPYVRPRIQRTLAAAAHVVCVCRELGDVARELGTEDQRLSIIGNGIDPGLFLPQEQQAARAQLGLPAAAKLLLSVGHLTERKGFHVLIEALARLRAAPPQGAEDTRLVIVGDGPQRAELHALVAGLGLQGQVHFGGAQAQEALPTWYAAADMFLLASSREGWPNVMCEAQAMGLPAVASHVWGMSEILTDASLGILVKERSAAAFEAALRQALAQPWDRAHIARVGGRRTWPIVAEEVDAVFRSVLAPKGRRPSPQPNAQPA